MHLAITSPPYNVVLHPFGGTGTVAVVAKKTGRHFIHVDVWRKYCQIAAQRLGRPLVAIHSQGEG